MLDLNKCTGCKACEAWCRRENKLPKRIFRIRVIPFEPTGPFSYDPSKKEIDKRWGLRPSDCGKGKMLYVPMQCFHCGKAPCIPSCPVGAITRRDDGIVYIVVEKCIGCKLCIEACPFGAIQYDDERGKADKCHFCMHLIDQGKKPACVAGCRFDVFDFGTLDELSDIIQKEKITLFGIIPELEYIEPTVFYWFSKEQK